MWLIDFSDSVIYSLIWALLQENKQKKKRDRDIQIADINMNFKKERLAFHYPSSYYIILQTIHHVWKAVSVCFCFWVFFGLCCAAKIKYLGDMMRRWSALCCGCWAFQQSAALDCAFFLLRNYTFIYIYNFFHFFCTHETPRWTEICG